jgi:hypothetical protein
MLTLIYLLLPLIPLPSFLSHYYTFYSHYISYYSIILIPIYPLTFILFYYLIHFFIIHTIHSYYISHSIYYLNLSIIYSLSLYIQPIHHPSTLISTTIDLTHSLIAILFSYPIHLIALSHYLTNLSLNSTTLLHSTSVLLNSHIYLIYPFNLTFDISLYLHFSTIISIPSISLLSIPTFFSNYSIISLFSFVIISIPIIC